MADNCRYYYWCNTSNCIKHHREYWPIYIWMTMYTETQIIDRLVKHDRDCLHLLCELYYATVGHLTTSTLVGVSPLLTVLHTHSWHSREAWEQGWQLYSSHYVFKTNQPSWLMPLKILHGWAEQVHIVPLDKNIQHVHDTQANTLLKNVALQTYIIKRTVWVISVPLCVMSHDYDSNELICCLQWKEPVTFTGSTTITMFVMRKCFFWKQEMLTIISDSPSTQTRHLEEQNIVLPQVSWNHQVIFWQQK